jgi:hydrogenase-4 component F
MTDMTLVIALAVVPVGAGVIGLIAMPAAVRERITVASSAVCACCALILVVRGRFPISGTGETVYVDGLSAVLVITVALVYLLASIYAVGYFDYERNHQGFRIYNVRFHVLFNLFAATMFWVPLTGNLLFVWVAVEATTVVSALLVGLEQSGRAAEAAWKYILIASSGLVVALLGLMLFYFAGSKVLGNSYSPTYTALLGVAPRLAPSLVAVAFALVVIGYGTKAGLVPLHTWLPDAHSEGPTPVSAMLSGALLADAIYGILRVLPIATKSVGSTFPHALLLIFGVASLLVAGFVALRQTNLKRLYAYSSIEQMGIIAVGVAFGTPLALYGVMLHIVAHGATKALAFFGAGNIRQRFRTRDDTSVRGLASTMPITAVFLVAGAFGIGALPPAALFRSEVTILVGGAFTAAVVPAVVLVLASNLVFLRGLRVVNGMTFSEPRESGPSGESSPWMLVAMGLACVPAVLLFFFIPSQLNHIFDSAAHILGTNP